MNQYFAEYVHSGTVAMACRAKHNAKAEVLIVAVTVILGGAMTQTCWLCAFPAQPEGFPG